MAERGIASITLRLGAGSSVTHQSFLNGSIGASDPSAGNGM